MSPNNSAAGDSADGSSVREAFDRDTVESASRLLIGALAITLAFAIGWLQATGRLFRRRDKNDKDTAE